MFRTPLVPILFIYILCAPLCDACTSVLVTAGASTDGSTMISYSCDGEFHPHLRLIPAASHEPGEMVAIESWYGRKKSIPQVARTYQVVGLMNEHQLAIGETTFEGRKELQNQEGLFDYYHLMLLALQRAKTAREAIDVMTDLVGEYGYASTGESFSIADKREVWLLEMIGKGPGLKGAVWVALRIPDGQVCCHANMARIRTFSTTDRENVRYAADVVSFAIAQGYYDPQSGAPFSFSAAYNPPTEEQVRYAGRRVWRIFDRIAASRELSPDYSSSEPGSRPYPLSLTPDKPLSVADVIALHRDHYEGTAFDMTKDLTAGPYGAPDRWRPLKWTVNGRRYAWERPIATQQAAFVFVSQSRMRIPDSVGGVLWYGLDNPDTSVFVPFYTSITRLPAGYTTGSLQRFTPESTWWLFNFVSNYANLRYRDMIRDIRCVQADLEHTFFAFQPYIEQTAQAMAEQDGALMRTFLTRYCLQNAQWAHTSWQKLSEGLITTYNDGYIQDEHGRPKQQGYPEGWLSHEVARSPQQYRLQEERTGDEL